MNESEMKVKILDLEERVSKIEASFSKAAVELEELNSKDIMGEK
jgi:hypothetical protein